MKHQTTSEPTSIAPPSAPSANGSIDTATIELLASWRVEDAEPTADQIRVAEEELREFKRAMNENRASTGQSVLYP